ncbi:formimidoylglutamate deiminase [Actinophytocola algeriensis]|uniref:Formiminoglutamate deiminase n=1 Tax=Actinophytocola algeriensis TaxID=1768010 RepID=A0A7W7PZG0_9PSEU|nr:formimidoylglutamate deiminase [Actinophytocola algeriensis]MBB4904016.1 formiminoglutamate deiminase [Actinophytocola algeriensis]MBE1477127.1 formiminoglutamate deiminase [Actinophytocola algeriensis]
MTTFWCEHAWVDGAVAPGVVVGAGDGRITAVSRSDSPPPGAHVLRGMVFPGFANVHSHAFHRALRGRTHAGGGTFWTWRRGMYQLASRLDPESYLKLATAVYAEMAVTGVTAVGEFHYLHHPPGGGRYASPNAMGDALREAARAAGIRLTLLDTLYLTGGIDTAASRSLRSDHQTLSLEQQQFSDGSVDAWADRALPGHDDATTRAGAAIHSVRAVPRDAIADLASIVEERALHVHVSEQPAENEACLAAYGLTPVRLLAESGALGPNTTAVHATHLTGADIETLGSSHTAVCFCPTTEADLADGIGPARELVDAGAPLSLGSDQHAIVDPLAEVRALEHGERLRTGQRGRFTPVELITALTSAGNAALGWPDAGTIRAGAPADLTAVRLDSIRTAGSRPDQVQYAATASDVHTVVSGGVVIAENGQHARLGDVGRLLTDAIEELWT